MKTKNNELFKDIRISFIEEDVDEFADWLSILFTNTSLGERKRLSKILYGVLKNETSK